MSLTATLSLLWGAVLRNVYSFVCDCMYKWIFAFCIHFLYSAVILCMYVFFQFVLPASVINQFGRHAATMRGVATSTVATCFLSAQFCFRGSVCIITAKSCVAGDSEWAGTPGGRMAARRLQACMVHVRHLPPLSPPPRTSALLFCSLAVLDPRVGHTTDVLSPFISVLSHYDWLFPGEPCPPALKLPSQDICSPDFTLTRTYNLTYNPLP